MPLHVVPNFAATSFWMPTASGHWPLLPSSQPTGSSGTTKKSFIFCLHSKNMLPQWSLMPAQHCSVMPMQMQGDMTQQNSATHLMAMALQQNVLAAVQNVDAGNWIGHLSTKHWCSKSHQLWRRALMQEIASDMAMNVDCHIDATAKAKQRQQQQHKCCGAEHWCCLQCYQCQTTMAAMQMQQCQTAMAMVMMMATLSRCTGFFVFGK